MINIRLSAVLIFIVSVYFDANTATLPSFDFSKDDSTKKQDVKKPVRTYRTVRLTTVKPQIDGVLDDDCWKTGEWSGNFTQWIPNEGAKPSQPTELKILYDDKNVYVAIRAFDSEPHKILRKAGRRDELSGDMMGVTFDSYHDHRTGFEFDVTAAGQKIDLILTNPMAADYNWNAVWYGKSAMEDSAWTVEMEIPLSQLRYSGEKEQVWGLHCWRWIDRLQEESDWEPQTTTGPGMLYLFGEIHGIKGLSKERRIELMPYGLGKFKTYKKEPGNPFAYKGKSASGNFGLDAKIGLSSSFTADLTVNPDFGQVESDPSVMNLTAFETFYEEKRPFFLEGKNIFDFDFGDASIFYSRRIGHAPSYSPTLNDKEYLNMPDNTTILSAAKFSGKTANGLSVGVLQSFTAREQAEVNTSEGNKMITAEPFTNYFVGRVQQDYNQSNTVFGGIFTSTNRFIRDSHLNFMNREAYTGGLDLLHQWKDKEYYVNAKIVGSDIKGKSEAINELQTSSAHYFQRQDANYLQYDTALTQLSGFGGKIKIGKGSKGLWRYSTEVSFRSPGLDLNDIGFMQMADVILQNNNISYFVNKPVSIFRTYSIGIVQDNRWNFGMNHISSGANANFYFEFLNKWGVSAGLTYSSQALDTRLLRGGYAMLVPATWSGNWNWKTDMSKKLFFGLNSRFFGAGNNVSKFYSFGPSVSYRPINTLKLAMDLNYSKNVDELQYVDTKIVNSCKKYILAKINQETIGLTFRIDYNITPEISLQYYGSPFASVGKYSNYKEINNPKAPIYSDRFTVLDNPVLSGNDYQIDENNDGKVVYSFANPDFNFYQFRSNLVFRWEYRPGSQLFLVWSNDRTQWNSPGYYGINDAPSQLSHSFPNNIFLIKLNYWFSI